MNSNDSFRRAGERIEKLLDELRAMAEPSTWPRVEELMRLVVELYGPGLTRFVELLDTDLTIDKLRERVLEDELLASLMLLHGLHPEDTAARVARALDRVRPYLGSHGGDVTVVGVDERAGVVKLRLDGTCDGCPSSALTVKLTVESAIRELAPEIARIEVEGISERENPLNSMIAKSHVDGANGNGSAAVSREQTKLAGDVCELCSIALSEKHSHLVNMESRNLVCSCRACYLLFTAEVAAQGHYRAVPDRYLHDSSFALTQSAWDAFQIPVRIAFFFHNSLIGRIVALYPGPAGATESMLDLRAWDDLRAANPMLETMQPDVEALLVYDHRNGEFDCFIVPIDACYELTGTIRRRWKGFDGGEQAWNDVDAFFDKLRERSQPAAFGGQLSDNGDLRPETGRCLVLCNRAIRRYRNSSVSRSKRRALNAMRLSPR